MNTTTENKPKFTAALLHEADKARIIELRNKSGLSEKDLMTLIVDAAMTIADEIVAKGQKITADSASNRETNRKAKYELLKEAMKQARETAKANVAKANAAKKEVAETPVAEVPAIEAPVAEAEVAIEAEVPATEVTAEVTS
jgi:hypothetical protein